MLGYYIRLSLKSFARNPGLSALMVLAIALGIAVCVTTLTVYHAMSGNPIWWKGDQLYTVTLDSWSIERPANKERPQLPPWQLTYRDARYLFDSEIPARKVIMYPAIGIVRGGASESSPLRVSTRLTTSDFFDMFDVPFRYGRGWNASADRAPEPVIVISRSFNERLFGGVDSTGRTLRWNNLEFRIIGVLEEWRPQPRFYDITTGYFDDPEEAFVPFGWGDALELRTSGTTSCWKFEPISTWQDYVGSECVWLQMWVELPTIQARDRMQQYLDVYWSEQHKVGRFERPQNNRLTTVDQWLQDHEVVQDDNRLLVVLAFAFLGVCLINTVGLLLARFLNGATSAGIRRALGASRAQIVAQHLVEVGVLAAVSSVVGLGLSALLLWGVRVLYTGSSETGGGYQELAHFDFVSIVWALVLAAAAALLAGLYPAWRIGRLPPAVYLKSQ